MVCLRIAAVALASAACTCPAQTHEGTIARLLEVAKEGAGNASAAPIKAEDDDLLFSDISPEVTDLSSLRGRIRKELSNQASKGFASAITAFSAHVPGHFPVVVGPAQTDPSELGRAASETRFEIPVGGSTLEKPKPVQRQIATISDVPLVKVAPVAIDPKREVLGLIQRIATDERFSAVSTATLNAKILDRGAGPFSMRLCNKPSPLCKTLMARGWQTLPDGTQVLHATFEGSAKKPFGHATFVKTSDGLTATFRTAVGTYTLQPAGNDGYVLSHSADRDRQMNDALLDGAGPAGSPVGPLASVAPPDCPDIPDQVSLNVLILATNAAVTAIAASGPIGRPVTALNLVHHSNSDANESFRRSHINAVVNVLPIHYTDYVESGDYAKDIAEILKPDGVLHTLAKARFDNKADVAVLIVDNPDDTSCGLAAGINVDASKAYAVVNWRCLQLNYSFIHEIGHLAGAWHDQATLDREGNKEVVDPPYAHGYVTDGEFPIATIMAYRSSCPRTCNRDYYWADPNLKTDDEQVLGSSKSFDACILRRRLPTMVKWRFTQ